MRYEEFPPAASLRQHVRCIWRFEADPGEAQDPERIVPDGRCELVLHYGDPFVESSRGRPESVQPLALLAGQLSRPLWLRATGSAGVLGVRFHPAGARAFLGLSMASVTDCRVPLQSLWPEEARALTARIAQANSEERIDVAQQFVAARIRMSESPIDDAVAKCATAIESRRGRCNVEQMMAASGLGRRQLERRFSDAVGLSPKRFAAVLRLRSVFDVLQEDPRADWTDAALAAGYFDQSHLIRDFRRFVGCTPAQFVAARAALAPALLGV